MKIQNILTLILLTIVLNSCCNGAKEEYLGNNIYLSEYDNIDRRVLYQTESCAISGAEIIPMTVLEFSYNNDWIIAKSGNKRKENGFKFWVIKNHYKELPELEIIQKNLYEFDNRIDFDRFLMTNKIALELKKID